ncbi:MAG: stage II sporulation protein E, partial [Spirochaetaceae bacterium]|nr:stage II sporulation protein E [Spirochaetaceae bacterium]
GPPVHPESDREIASIFSSFTGKKVVSGGTTATIISRELDRRIKVNMKSFSKKVPPWSEMEGADLVTEGIITLGAVSTMLEKRQEIEASSSGQDAASRIVRLLLDSDRITFIVGTKINEAHQDPSMPVELEIRRNVIKHIASLLKEKYLKEIHIRYF